MQDRLDVKRLWRWSWPLAAALVLVGCARPDTSAPTGKLSDVFATPDWAKFSSSKPVAQRAVTPDDLLTADGRCAAAADPALATSGASEVAIGGSPEATSAALSGQGSLPQLQSGVALAMTECQVVQRTGTPDRFDIGAEGTERVATMTVMHGSWPGLYRFRGGRLVSIERIELPPAPKPVRAVKPKKTPAKSAQQSAAPLRRMQQ